jgi:hypothetical protein
MAIVCTHFRLAVESRRLFDVSDERSFFSGAVYPDSRYITGVRRIVTHGPDCPNDPFAPGLSDFDRGWALHNLHDYLSHAHYYRLMPWPDERPDTLNNRAWKHISAQKVVEDMTSFAALGVEAWLMQHIVFPNPSPRGEDAGLLEKYYSLMRGMYGKAPSLEDYRVMWLNYGGRPEDAEEMSALAGEMLAGGIAAEIGSIYEKVREAVIGMSKQTRLA